MEVKAGDIIHFTQEDGNRLKIFIGTDGICIDNNRLETKLSVRPNTDGSLNVKSVDRKGT